ncbi:HAD-like domain-containing protein [Chiua virens]|nr:HAD-like domain-containing protein [Chiua virens]
MKLSDHHVLIFDVYGTLVDWESAIHEALHGLPVFHNLTREEGLVIYAGIEGNLQTQFQNTPYSQILELAYRQLANPSEGGVSTAGIEEGSLRKVHASTSNVQNEDDGAKISCVSSPDVDNPAQRFGRSIPDWKPFPDTIDALHRLKKTFRPRRLIQRTHWKLCTPDHPGSAYHTVTPDSPFSLVLTAQQIGAYKPNPLMLECALRQLSANPDPSLPSIPGSHFDPSHVLAVANSIRHDIIPAMQHDLHSVWISRHGANFIGNESTVAQHHSKEGLAVGGKYPYTWRYETLGRMADSVEAEKSLS